MGCGVIGMQVDARAVFMRTQTGNGTAAGLRVPLVAQAAGGQQQREVVIARFGVVVVVWRSEPGATIRGSELEIGLEAFGAGVVGAVAPAIGRFHHHRGEHSSARKYRSHGRQIGRRARQRFPPHR